MRVTRVISENSETFLISSDAQKRKRVSDLAFAMGCRKRVSPLRNLLSQIVT